MVDCVWVFVSLIVGWVVMVCLVMIVCGCLWVCSCEPFVLISLQIWLLDRLGLH